MDALRTVGASDPVLALFVGYSRTVIGKTLARTALSQLTPAWNPGGHFPRKCAVPSTVSRRHVPDVTSPYAIALEYVRSAEDALVERLKRMYQSRSRPMLTR